MKKLKIKSKEEKEIKLPEAFHIKRVRGQEIIAPKRTKSVLIPITQYTKMCDVDAVVGQDVHGLVSSVARVKDLDLLVYYIAVIQLTNGCRISEVLRVASGDILENGNFIVRGLKRSADRICSCTEARDYLLRCRKNNFAPFQDIDRYYVARIYEKCGLYMVLQGYKKRATTHALRHLYIKSAKGKMQSEHIKSSIGHKSLTSTRHYENTKEGTSSHSEHNK